ncbi:MAG: hypothetical protein KDI03_17560, partial [Anaerolineae bacterium]|nr:hypothetical protein [Anaerolineae bacterium]
FADSSELDAPGLEFWPISPNPGQQKVLDAAIVAGVLDVNYHHVELIQVRLKQQKDSSSEDKHMGRCLKRMIPSEPMDGLTFHTGRYQYGIVNPVSESNNRRPAILDFVALVNLNPVTHYPLLLSVAPGSGVPTPLTPQA